jgi:hypothetical protein
MNLDKIAKAIVAFVGAVLTGLLAAMADGHVTATEWIVLALAGLATFGITWGVPNAPKEPTNS